MLYKSEHITAASGSIGGVTYSHNAAGLYRRARAIPVNPNSGNQLDVRNSMTQLVNAWLEELTDAQRASWDLYAQAVPVTNKLGDAVKNSGQNWYIGNNTPRLQADTKLGTTLGRVDDAPTIFDRGLLTAPTIDGISASASADIGFTNSDPWAAAVGGALLIYQGQPVNPSINFFKGPFRLVAVVPGAAIPPTSPESILTATLAAEGYTVAEGQAQYFAFRAVTDDGRLTSKQIVGPEIWTA